MNRSVVGIGWDVGGWMGKKNAVAIAHWKPSANVEWIGKPSVFLIPDDHPFCVKDLIDAVDDKKETINIEKDNIVIAIDAPLGYPKKYQEFIKGKPGIAQRPTNEIENLLAYRYTERWIQGSFKKKPLSATFSSLGNCATVAISAVRRWSDENGFAIVPFKKDNGKHIVIEVYPRIVKIDFIKKHLPSATLTPKMHEYDACVCALMALAFRINKIGSKSFEIIHPPRDHMDLVKSEGWIYTVSKNRGKG